ncbi:MAG TPA: suppressor of fused domain protein [Pyrinomonadaceae bacterium]|jgi:hypothetical protein|nr:suppressor of fused domain protein [Pyrinomonadaceae bacterium]
MKSLKQSIIEHYESHWASQAREVRWERGRIDELPDDFCVLEFPPGKVHKTWIYATCCMSQVGDEHLLEVCLFAPQQNDMHVELLTVIAHYHRTGSQLNFGHTVNFGRPWLPGSKCEFGLLSKPYLDGPEFEVLELSDMNETVHFSWLIPITREEREFKKEKGLEALEQQFESQGLDYLDAHRASLI